MISQDILPTSQATACRRAEPQLMALSCRIQTVTARVVARISGDSVLPHQRSAEIGVNVMRLSSTDTADSGMTMTPGPK